ncbi:hypothetical protein TWF730_010328 [Orbilia blumenaviensis]|uniref:F-box domain-containing protein n=1 Tax=Orbilia blumenaviensis TaxID=1796055 RepID=A0AAV9USG7_9PEZI
MSTSSFLLSPAEIQDEILGYLCKTDLASFSSCSKKYREVTFPLLYAGLKVTPDSVAAFRDGGALASFRHCVRKLYLASKTYEDFEGQTINDTITHIQNFYPCIRSLQQFTNVKSIKVVCTENLWENIYAALWAGVSKIPNLNDVEFKLQEGRSRALIKYWGQYQLIYSLLSSEIQEFLGPDELSEEGHDAADYFTKPLETICINVRTTMLPTENTASHLVKFPIKSSINSLRKLKITTNRLNDDRVYETRPQPEATKLIFPNLTTVEIDELPEGYFSYQRLFGWLATHCPGLKSLALRISTDGRIIVSGDYGVEFNGLFQIPQLVKVIIPWPRKFERHMRYKRRELDAAVRGMVDAGMHALREVTFRRGPRWRAHYHQYVAIDCRICKDEGGKLRIWWRKPFALEIGQKSFVEEEDDGEGSGDDLDQEPPFGVELGYHWKMSHAQTRRQ